MDDGGLGHGRRALPGGHVCIYAGASPTESTAENECAAGSGRSVPKWAVGRAVCLGGIDLCAARVSERDDDVLLPAFSAVPRIVSWVDNFGLFNGLGLAVVMVGVFLSNPLSKRFGKRNTFQACLLLWASRIRIRILLCDATWELFGLQMLLQLAFGPTIPLLWAMMADVADYAEWKTGRRSTVLAFASIVFRTEVGFRRGRLAQRRSLVAGQLQFEW